MFHGFSERLIKYIVKLGYVSEDETEEYIYGFDLILSVIFSDIAMLIIGVCMNMIPQVIAFALIYKCIRKNSGGFHCETALTCFISSCTMCICVLLAIKYIPYDFTVYMVTATICLVILFVMSPVEAINKPLDDDEFKVFGRRARIVICVIFAIFTAVCIIGLSSVIKVMAISIADVALFAVLGKMKLIHHDKKTAEQKIF